MFNANGSDASTPSRICEVYSDLITQPAIGKATNVNHGFSSSVLPFRVRFSVGEH